MVRTFGSMLLLLALRAIELAVAQAPAIPVLTNAAKAAAAEPEKVVGQASTFVKQLPQLPGGGGSEAILKAVQGQVRYPPAALRQSLEGIVVASFLVDKDGVVWNSKIIKNLGGGCDEEVLAAVRRLPRFIPGTQAGKPVAVSVTVPVTFRMQGSQADLLDTLPVPVLFGRLPKDN